MRTTRSLPVLGRTVPLWALGLAFLALGLVAYAPYLGMGFSSDDFFFINMLEGAIPYHPLQGFWSGGEGSFQSLGSPWWTEISPDAGFLRPLASWALTLLYRLFGRDAVPYHAALAMLHGLGAFSVFLVLRQVSGRDAPALLAALLFLVCEDHAMTVAWISTITDLLCALFLNLAFLGHIVARQGRKAWLFALSLALFLAALASKETAAVYPLIVAAYEFFYPKGSYPRRGSMGRFAGRRADESTRPLEGDDPVGLIARVRLFLQAWWAWAIPLALLAAYMALYRSLIPPMRSLMYVDPFTQPGRYLALALANLPVMFLALLTPMPSSLVLMVPGILPFVIAAGLLLVALLVWALHPYRRERALWLALVIFVLGLLPGLAAEVGERLLYFPSAYGLFVLAWLILQIPSLRRRFTPDAPPGVRLLGPAWGWYSLIWAAILPVILLFVYPWMWIPMFRLPERTLLDSLPLIQEGRHQHVVYLNTNSSFNTFYLPEIYRYHRGQYIDLRLLSSFNGRLSARQEAGRALLLETEDAGWLGNMFARVLRVTPELEVGDAYTTPLFTATILALTPGGQDVQAVRFEFILPLDDPSLLFLYYDGGRYRRWEPSPEWELLNPRLDPWAF
jgi:hypothetical protein